MKPKNFNKDNGNGNIRTENPIEDAICLSKSRVDKSFSSETKKISWSPIVIIHRIIKSTKLSIPIKDL